jgi:5-methyltetrahydropteroyltriglutamate--homocysteine methyltransferase
MELKDMLDLILKIKAGAYSFEGANPRHEHEYELWETTKLPHGKILMPGSWGFRRSLLNIRTWLRSG